jgi:hypothetical protein
MTNNNLSSDGGHTLKDDPLVLDEEEPLVLDEEEDQHDPKVSLIYT